MTTFEGYVRADGSVDFKPYTIDQNVFRSLGTRNGKDDHNE